MAEQTKSIRVLVADDDPAVHEALKEAFSVVNLHLISAYDGEQAANMLESENPDFVVTDIMMPKKDGLELLRQIRAHSDLPVMILSARGDEFDRLLGLQLGADDYIAKPFSAREVAAKIRIIMRRLTPRQTEEDKEIVTVGNLEISLKAYDVKLNGKSVPCTRKEIKMLWTLASHPGIAFTREHLLQAVWEDDYNGDARAIDSHIKRIRAKLYDENNKWDIQTVWGIGYRFEIED